MFPTFGDRNQSRTEKSSRSSVCCCLFTLDADVFICLCFVCRQFICDKLMEVYGIHCSAKNVLSLDSSTGEKFSRHLIFNLQNAAFKDNIHVGMFNPPYWQQKRFVCLLLQMQFINMFWFLCFKVGSSMQFLNLSWATSEMEVYLLFLRGRHHQQRRWLRVQRLRGGSRRKQTSASSRWKTRMDRTVSLLISVRETTHFLQTHPLYLG